VAVADMVMKHGAKLSHASRYNGHIKEKEARQVEIEIHSRERAERAGAIRVDGCALEENVGCDSDPIYVEVFFPRAAFVFVKGSRPDAATLIAYADTIWRGSWKSEEFTYTDEEGEEYTDYLRIGAPDIGEHRLTLGDDGIIRSLEERRTRRLRYAMAIT
jgi:hypothetical protein